MRAEGWPRRDRDRHFAPAHRRLYCAQRLQENQSREPTMFGFKKIAMPTAAQALPGRNDPIRTADAHFVNTHGLKGPYPEGSQKAIFGLGCFWGAERKFWELGDGVHVTAVGYAGGVAPNPIYEEVCSGRTGHNEVVLVVYDPKKIFYETLLKTFGESHDPTQGMRQGNDVGTQYRSGIYTFTPEQRQAAEASKAMYETAIKGKGYGATLHNYGGPGTRNACFSTGWTTGNSSGIKVLGFTIKGSSPAGGTIAAYHAGLEYAQGFGLYKNAVGWEIADCTITDQWGDGIYVAADPAGPYSQNLNFHHNAIARAGRQGIAVRNGIGLTFADNTITELGRAHAGIPVTQVA